MRIVHITSVHNWSDVRIFEKMCVSLARAGHEVHLVVPAEEELASAKQRAVQVHPIPRPVSRVERATRTARDVAAHAIALSPDIIHLHDPELLLHTAELGRSGAAVVYDVHDDLRLDLVDRPWLPSPAGHLVSFAFGVFEDWKARHVRGVVAATPAIARRFVTHPRCALVQNYPILDEMPPAADAKRCTGRFAFVGGVNLARGVLQMVEALGKAGDDCALLVAGRWESAALRAEAEALPAWSRVDAPGNLARGVMMQRLAECQAGLVLYQPVSYHLEAQPNKLFEYMAAGLPVIASAFPHWEGIVGAYRCGLLVDPREPEQIGKAMRWMADHPVEAAEMGRRGRAAVESAFNWDLEFRALQNFYANLDLPA